MDPVRITIKWNNVTPFLQAATGILTASKQIWPHAEEDGQMRFVDIFSCKVNVEQRVVGYEALDEKGIKSLYFDLYKEKIDIMLRSYFDGIILAEDTFFWISEPEYYTVTVLEAGKRALKSVRCIAFTIDKMKAIDLVCHNAGDMSENGSNTYSVIERIEPGLLPRILESIWFKWDKEKKEYVGCDIPKKLCHITNFGIG